MFCIRSVKCKYLVLISIMRIELITEMTHALHETYFMLRHYEWKRKGERHRTPMLVFMVDGVKDFYSGGMADRFKGMIASYAWCKQRDIEFRIRHIFPYELADYLEPSQYDWRLKEGEFTKCIWDSTLIYNRRVLGKRFVRKKLKRKQLHYYGNRDILHYINKKLNLYSMILNFIKIKKTRADNPHESYNI